MAKNTASQLNPQRARAFLWMAGLSTVGAIIVHSYLLTRHFALKFGAVNTKSLCDISATFNCEAVAASRYAEFLGVPMALWGAAFNTALLILLATYPLTDEAKKPAARRNLLLLGGIIASASIVMGGISLLLMKTFCLFCILTYVLSFISFAGLWKGLQAPSLSPAAQALGGTRFQAKDFTSLAVAIGIALAGAFIANDQIGKSYGVQDMQPFVNAQIQEWESNPQMKIQTVEPLVRGPAPDQAKMTIVEFADFRCIHCKHAAPTMNAFAAAHPDVRFEFQVWPLDGECNTSISSANGASCLLARAVYCAEKLAGKGWDAHEYVYEHFENWGSLPAVQSGLGGIAQSAGIAADQMMACTQSQETKSAIERQAAVGSALNLHGTPTIFVNGKQLPAGQSLPVLSEAYKRSISK